MESLHFIYDGKTSDEMGLYIMRIDSSGGFVEVPFWGEAEIEEERYHNKLTPYYFSISYEPIEFTVQFVLADKYMQPKKWTPQERYKIGEWLAPNGYKPFQTSDDLGKIYYAMCVSPVNLHLLNTKGYIEVTFRTNSPFAWTTPIADTINLSDNTSTRIIELENRSNVLKYYYPQLEIELVNNETNVSLRNLSDGGRVFSFEELLPNEIVSVDNKNKLILSNNPLSNPFKKFNRNWFRLVKGINRIEITGQCIIRYRMQFPIAQ